jgi:15-cis-phytoene synthase
MQLTNIARDVGEDARNGRLYLPRQWLREAGIDPDAWLRAPRASRRHRRRRAAPAEVRRRAVPRAEHGIAELPRDCRPAILRRAWCMPRSAAAAARRAGLGEPAHRGVAATQAGADRTRHRTPAAARAASRASPSPRSPSMAAPMTERT